MKFITSLCLAFTLLLVGGTAMAQGRGGRWGHRVNTYRVYRQPVYQPVVYRQPVYQPVVYRQPVYVRPHYAPRVYRQPVYVQPTYAPRWQSRRVYRRWH